jgi:hypothetical protein
VAENELCYGEKDGTAKSLGEDEDGHADRNGGRLQAVLNGNDGLDKQSEMRRDNDQYRGKGISYHLETKATTKPAYDLITDPFCRGCVNFESGHETDTDDLDCSTSYYPREVIA